MTPRAATVRVSGGRKVEPEVGTDGATPIPVDVYRYRVLFADGVVQDFLAISDNSDVRGAMFEAHYGRKSGDRAGPDRIEGVTRLGIAYTYTPGS